jgi:hypothetical protein
MLEKLKGKKMKKRMKKLSLLALGLMLAVVSVFAQDSPEKKFAFNSKKVTLSNFYVEVAPKTNFAKLNGQMANIGMVTGGFILNDKFSIAFFSATSPKVNLLAVPPSGSQEYSDWVEAGVELDKISSSTEFVHVNSGIPACV